MAENSPKPYPKVATQKDFSNHPQRQTHRVLPKQPQVKP